LFTPTITESAGLPDTAWQDLPWTRTFSTRSGLWNVRLIPAALCWPSGAITATCA
jgi:hypothetical protein